MIPFPYLLFYRLSINYSDDDDESNGKKQWPKNPPSSSSIHCIPYSSSSNQPPKELIIPTRLIPGSREQLFPTWKRHCSLLPLLHHYRLENHELVFLLAFANRVVRVFSMLIVLFLVWGLCEKSINKRKGMKKQERKRNEGFRWKYLTNQPQLENNGACSKRQKTGPINSTKSRYRKEGRLRSCCRKEKLP